MIRAFGLTKRFGDRTAVDNLTFSVPTGTVVGLLGLNGAGKTSALRMLTTFSPPTVGSAMVAGFDIVRDGEAVRHRIGYLPESPPIYPELRVSEYLHFVSRLRRLARSSVATALERFGLTSVGDVLCGELSRGYRQRVGLAQALIHDPEVVFLDEPTTGLDPIQLRETREIIRSLSGKHTVLFSSHLLQEVREVCSRILVLAGGRLVDEGELECSEAIEERFLQAVGGFS